jgi:tetratricopeptide (TPR) repeat protein
MRQSGIQICVVMAPSGFGKTTLLAQFARQFRGAVAWVSLDEDVYGVKDLGRAVCEAVQAEVTDFHAERWHEAVSDGHGGLRQASSFADDINATELKLCLIFDQGHLLNDATYPWLHRLITRLSSLVTVLLACYEMPSAEIFHLGQLEGTLVLTEEHLAFSSEEQRLLLKRKGVKFSKTSQGYPIALAMQTSGMAEVELSQVFGARFQTLSSEAQQAMLELAFCSTWDRGYLEDDRFLISESLVDEVMSRGFPVRRVGDVYAPHNLLLSFLKDRVSILPLSERNEIYNKAGSALAKRNFMLDALICYKLSESQETIIPLLEQFVMYHFGEADYHAALNALSLFDISHLPIKFQVWFAQALLETGRASEGISHLEMLHMHYSSDPLIAFAYSLVQQRLARYTQALEAVSQIDTHQLHNHIKCRILLSRYESLFGLGQWQEIGSLLEKIVPLSTSVSHVHLAWNWELLGTFYAYSGDYSQSVDAFVKALRIYQVSHTYPRTVSCFNRFFEIFQFQSETWQTKACLERMLSGYEEPDILRAQMLWLLEAYGVEPDRTRELQQLEQKLCTRFKSAAPVVIEDISLFRPIFEVFDQSFPHQPRLVILEGHRIEVFLNEQPVTLRLKKSLELLLYLAFYSQATQKQILRDVFPTKTATARTNFKTALSKLRVEAKRAGLSEDLVLYADGMYRFTPSLTTFVRRDSSTTPRDTLRFVEATFNSDWINERYLNEL